MTRLYGRAPKSERVIDYVPDVRFQRVSFLSTVRLNADMHAIAFNGTLNAQLFEEYIKTVLKPSLSKSKVLDTFIREIESRPLVLNEFVEKLWSAMIDRVTVDKDGGMVFRFRSGVEIEA